MRTKYEQTREEDDLKNYADSLKKKYQFSIDETNVQKIIDKLDSVSVSLYFNTEARDEVKDLPLFYFGLEPVIADSVFTVLKPENKFKKSVITSETMTDAVEFASNEFALQKAALELDKTDPEFADLMNDYMNGIFIFKIQEDEVWNKIKVDTTDLLNYYQTVKDDYLWPNRVEFQEIFSKSDSIINKCYSQIKEGRDFDSLLVFYTERPKMKGTKGKYEMMDAGSGDLAPKAYSLKNPGDISEPFKVTDGFAIVKLLKKEKSRLKTYEEVKAEIASRYQDLQGKKLEENYLNELRGIYNPKLYYEVLNQAFKKSNN